MTRTVHPVVVVGAGPTGVVAALLLAQHGIEVVLLERHRDVYAHPRAVHLDDEVFRVLQGIGLAEQLADLSRPAAGLRLLDREHRVLAEFARPAQGPHGFPQANMFDQPDLERVLRERVAASPGVQLRDGVEVTAVAHDPLRVVLHDEHGGTEELPAAAVLGCDGARSVVRRQMRSRWDDLRFEEQWLVVDVRCPVPLQVWPGVHQVCDGRRAATFLPVGPQRYRWEFQLADGERPEDLARPEALAELVRPWTAATPGAELEVLRSSGYVFSARLAQRWREGRVFLLGDAAHLTPPFIGQGLGLGLRDAANLAWKLAAVLQGRAPEALLDSYQAERRPHARALIRRAVLAGWAMTGGQGRAALARRVLLRAVVALPGSTGRVLDRGSPPLSRGPLVRRAPAGPARLVGRLAPQPHVVRDGEVTRLDDLLGPRTAVLTRAEPDPALEQLAQRLGAPLVRLVGPGALGSWLTRHGASTVVLRPDRYVLAAVGSTTVPGVELERAFGDVLRRVGA